MEHKPQLLKSAAVALAIITLFIVVSVIAHQYQDIIGSFIRAGGAAGPILFVIVAAISIVFLIPLDVSLLIPLAIAAWGSLATAFLSIFGWAAGSAFSFYLARRYGRPFVERAVGTRRVREAEAHVPKTHLFWWVVGAQALLQIDFISYVFGLFTEIGLKEYVLATALGDLLPAFFFAYVGALPVWYELAAIVAGLCITGFFFWRFTRHAWA